MPSGKQIRSTLPRYAVVMAGGHGTRFWPRSRRRTPKQLLSIVGRHSLLQETVARLLPLFSWRHIVIVTNTQHAPEVRRQLPRLAEDQVIVEPIGRNTLPCTLLAAEWIRRRAPDALMVVAPSDHVIKNGHGLRRTLDRACKLAAARDCLVTIGIAPSAPDTGYGYIEIGRPISGRGRSAAWVRRFHEKPSEPVARRYVRSGRFLWNSGMFAWKLSVLRAAVHRCAPQISVALDGIWAGRKGRSPRAAQARRLARVYRGLPSVSIDVAVMQPITQVPDATLRVAVLRAEFDWNDVGSWVAMPEVWGCDRDGNAALGKILSIDSSDAIVYSPDRLVALVGVKGLIVVDSPDALLICARPRAQDVRKVTEALQAKGWSRYV